jgi:rare lipoprotein A
MRLPVDRFLPISALILLAACGGATHAEVASPPVTVGPGADYPIVVGAPFTIDGVTYTPADKLNVDQVGYAYAGAQGGTAVSAAHRTLPVPSYVEVTSLESGKTILVRIERRGPMTGDGLIELSPAATAQLGINPAGKIEWIPPNRSSLCCCANSIRACRARRRHPARCPASPRLLGIISQLSLQPSHLAPQLSRQSL